MGRRNLWIVPALAALCLLPFVAQAQYVPIPNEPAGAGCPTDPTQCSGYKVRSDINARFSGAQGIEPKLDSYIVATLPAEIDQKEIWVSDAQPGVATCTTGGSGTIAIGKTGSWNCAAAAGGGGGGVSAVTGTPPVTSTGGTTPVIGISGVTSEQGNGSKVQLSTGSTTTNDLVKYDANGNAVDSGSPGSAGPSLFVYPQTFGAVADGQLFYDGSMVNGSSTLTTPVTRSVADMVTNSTTTITSATAAFVAGDKGAVVTGTNIPPGDSIYTVTNSTTAVLAVAATGAGSGGTLNIAGNHFVSGDVGKLICVGGISGVYGPTGSGAFGPVPQSELCGTISSFSSSSSVGLSFSSANGGTVHGVTIRFGTNNATALQNTVNSCTNGCTIALTGPFATNASLSIPPTGSINFIGTGSYAPDDNVGNPFQHILALGSGLWFVTKSLTTAGVIYGGTSANGSLIQNIRDEMRNLNLIAGSGPTVCVQGAGQCDTGWFGTLDGGGADGVDVNGFQGVHLYDVSISNFKGHCLATMGGQNEFIHVDGGYWNYCGGDGVYLSGTVWANQYTIEKADIENMGLSGVYVAALGGAASEYNDTVTLISNTLQWNNVQNTTIPGGLPDQFQAYPNLYIGGGKDQVVIGNWLEGDNAGAAANCFNAGGNNGGAGGSQLWIANHIDSSVTKCEAIQFNPNHTTMGTLPTCAAAYVGRENWVDDGTANPAYGDTYSGGGAAKQKVGCDGTNWRYGY